MLSRVETFICFARSRKPTVSQACVLDMLYRHLRVPVYFSGRPAIDVLGKSDRHIAKLEVDHFFPGHSKWDWDYVLEERRPDVFRAPSRGLGDRRDFRSAYVKVQTERGLSFFMRRDALDKLVDREVVIVDLTTGRPLRTGRRDESEES